MDQTTSFELWQIMCMRMLTILDDIIMRDYFAPWSNLMIESGINPDDKELETRYLEAERRLEEIADEYDHLKKQFDDYINGSARGECG
ncbi:hypothetical protein [Endozoicomonas sp. ALB032]|uniref:hypothetical protein n=1 Tax=Endozoicomonas sp. ALB032 TaxID=3403082 RepID=UPI003BB6C460